jgi:multidrug efflux pump subunit AcrA (membrane-fusion protein)
LALCFVVVVVVRYIHAHAVAKAGETAYSTPPPVDVVIARPATMGQDLVLPGETAAWYETTIYARVNGYVAKWLVDIGDHVKKGQLLATIETPELDAELEAARAQLKASEAQVVARKAEAEFSKTTNERWRDSPKGVVSEQERESKKGGLRKLRGATVCGRCASESGQIKGRSIQRIDGIQAGQGALRWNHHRTQDRHWQPGNCRQWIDDDAPVSHGADRSAAHFCRCSAEAPPEN